MHFCKIWKALLKNWARHAHFNFKTFWQEIQIWVHLESSNFVKSCLQLRSSTGKNLVLISQTTFEWSKIDHFYVSFPHLQGKNLLKSYLVGEEMIIKNGQSWITQKWFEISTPNFHQFKISWDFNFSQNLKVVAHKILYCMGLDLSHIGSLI